MERPKEIVEIKSHGGKRVAQRLLPVKTGQPSGNSRQRRKSRRQVNKDA
jgi:hypothetical protein